MSKTSRISKIAMFSAFLTTGAVASLAIAGIANAQGFEPLTNVPGLFEQGKVTNPIALLSGLYGLAIGIGAVIAVVMIIYAGFQYMYEESVFGKSEAKSRIINAFAGLALILGSYIILRTINTDLVSFSVALPGGDGTVKGLIASQAAIDAEITAKLHNQVLDVTTARNEASSAKAELDKITAELERQKSDYKSKCRVITEANQYLCDALEQGIASQDARKKTVEQSYSQKMIVAKLKESNALTGVALDDRISKKILNELKGGGTNGGDSPKEIFNEYSKEDLQTKIDLLKKNMNEVDSLPIDEDSRNKALIEMIGMLEKAEASKEFYDQVATIDIYQGEYKSTIVTPGGGASTVTIDNKNVNPVKLNYAAKQLTDIYDNAVKKAGDDQTLKEQAKKDYDNSANALKLYINGPSGIKACSETYNQGNILCKN